MMHRMALLFAVMTVIVSATTSADVAAAEKVYRGLASAAAIVAAYAVAKKTYDAALCVL